MYWADFVAGKFVFQLFLEQRGSVFAGVRSAERHARPACEVAESPSRVSAATLIRDGAGKPIAGGRGDQGRRPLRKM